jgi:hypothetical protein
MYLAALLLWASVVSLARTFGNSGMQDGNILAFIRQPLDGLPQCAINIANGLLVETNDLEILELLIVAYILVLAEIRYARVV